MSATDPMTGPVAGRLSTLDRFLPAWIIGAMVLGLGLAAWGAMLGLHVGGEHVNVRAIGVLIAAILGGWKAGGLAGLGGLVPQRDPQAATAGPDPGLISAQ